MLYYVFGVRDLKLDAKSLMSTNVLGLIANFSRDLPENHAFQADEGRNAAAEGLPSFETALRLFQKKIYNFTYRLLGDPEEAADLTQETFVKAYKTYSRFRGSSEAVYPWLCKIAVNSCKNRFKEIGRRNQYEVHSLDGLIDAEGSSMTFEIGDDSMNPAGMFEQHELEGKIQEAIQSLPPEFRIAVVLRDMQGLSYQEIVDATGQTMENVKIRLFRGREMLRRRLSPYIKG